MNDGDGRNLAGPASGLLLVAALIAGWLWFPSPMRSFRPEAPGGRMLVSSGDEDVPARLWEDPFSAVERGRAAIKEAGVEARHVIKTKGSGLYEQIKTRLDHRGESIRAEPEMTVIAAMVEGGWYAEPVEERRKQRQAVVSALGLRGFVPESADHIGVAILRSGGDTGKDAVGTRDLEVPFEWFVRDRTTEQAPAGPNSVLVLWIDEGRCATSSSGKVRPLGSLEQLVARILDDRKLLESGSVHLVVLGPATSTTLLSLLAAFEPHKVPPAAGTLLECADVISTRSTAPPDILRQRAGISQPGPGDAPPDDSTLTGACRPRRDTALRAEDLWLARTLGVRSFSSTLADDRAVIREILEELERRGIELDSPSTRIALVGEWDTAYSRTLGELVEEENVELHPWADPKLRAGTGRRRLARVESFRYLRGIDGQLPGEKPRSGADPASGDANTSIPSESERVAAMERPEGRSQLDAIQRLASRLERRESELRQSGGRLAAIGVLGSDLYDKQLILQALHARFAGAVFFTTDLDARLLHPSQYPWARNLVIGSSYGLELGDPLRVVLPWEVAPFRRCYQTSTFVGCLLAVGGVRPGWPDPELTLRVRSGIAAPRLYEVARDGAWDLSQPEPGWLRLHPRPRAELPFASRLLWLAAGLVGAVLAVSSPRIIRRTSPHCWSLDPRERAHLRRVRWYGLAAALVLVEGVWISTWDPGGEPFALLQGVSVWPTEVIRFIVGVFSIAALVHAAGDLRRDHRRLEQRYGLPQDHPEADDRPLPSAETAVLPPSGPLRWLLLSRWRNEDDGTACDANDPERQVAAAGLWRVYRRFGRNRNRWWRVLGQLVVLVALAGVLMRALGRPMVPARGVLAMSADRVVLLGSVVGMWLLTLWVFDVTRLSERLVRWFALRATSWPVTALEWIRGETGLDGHEAEEVLEVRLVADHTDVVSRFVVLPFVAVFLMILSRASVFDGWTWPLALVVVFAILLGLCLGSAVMLRVAAERSRRATLASLRRRRAELVGDESKEAGRRSRQIELAIKEVEGIRQGAFASWSQNPILRAVLLPFGGAGALWLVDLMSKLGF